MEITQQQLTEYFEESGATEACPSCGRTKWGIPFEPHTENEEVFHPAIGKLTLYDREIALGGSYVPVVIFVCNQCGFVKLVHAGRIESWLSSRLKGG